MSRHDSFDEEIDTNPNANLKYNFQHEQPGNPLLTQHYMRHPGGKAAIAYRRGCRAFRPQAGDHLMQAATHRIVGKVADRCSRTSSGMHHTARSIPSSRWGAGAAPAAARISEPVRPLELPPAAEAVGMERVAQRAHDLPRRSHRSPRPPRARRTRRTSRRPSTCPLGRSQRPLRWIMSHAPRASTTMPLRPPPPRTPRRNRGTQPPHRAKSRPRRCRFGKFRVSSLGKPALRIRDGPQNARPALHDP